MQHLDFLGNSAATLAQAVGSGSVVFWVILAVVGLIGLVALIVISQYIQLAVQAWLSGAPVSLL